LWLPAKPAVPISLPVHAGYEFAMPAIPTPALEESLAEKLAASRRRRKLRDLYDHDLFGRGGLNEPLIRRLLVLKVWHDVVDEALGVRPFDPAEVVADVDPDHSLQRTLVCSPVQSSPRSGLHASAHATTSSERSTTPNGRSQHATAPTDTRFPNSYSR
jgi:Nucleotidyl transferase AbiEii toxin, Type IV TA system